RRTIDQIRPRRRSRRGQACTKQRKLEMVKSNRNGILWTRASGSKEESMKKPQELMTVVRGKAKVSPSKVKKVARKPVRLDEDEADYQYSVAALKEAGGRRISAESVLKQYGRRVGR